MRSKNMSSDDIQTKVAWRTCISFEYLNGLSTAAELMIYIFVMRITNFGVYPKNKKHFVSGLMMVCVDEGCFR